MATPDILVVIIIHPTSLLYKSQELLTNKGEVQGLTT